MSSSDSSFSATGCQQSRQSGQPVREELTLLLGLLLGLLRSGTASGSSSASRGGSGTTARADGREKVLHVLALKSLYPRKTSQSVIIIGFRGRGFRKELRIVRNSYLGEKGSPDRLNLLDAGGFDDGLDLVGLTRTNLVQRDRSA